ncbi:MAG: M48 family metallopeptidase [Lachnospiraceae bacterium]|nr:M48 family metallopeptidase [Lachnospiraceae bacterium]
MRAHKSLLKPEIIRSSRKTLGLEVTSEGMIRIRAPYGVSEDVILRFLESKSAWIQKSLAKVRARQEKLKEEEAQYGKLTEAELKVLKMQAEEVFPARAAFYAGKMGISYGRITIRRQKTRWGSCSQSGNLNFNCLLMLAPPGVVDYVVVHELCHRIEMNHSPRFWELVGEVYPDYDRWKRWLKENGGRLMRMTEEKI